MVTPLELRRVALEGDTVMALITALNAELIGRYPEEGANHFELDADEVGPGRGAFFIAYRDDEPLGCGAIRRLEDDDAAEIKRMYVVPAARGQGVAGAILDALIDEARALRVARVVLETGVRQPEAIAVYRRAGFVEIPPFGEYVDSPFSVCMAKTL